MSIVGRPRSHGVCWQSHVVGPSEVPELRANRLKKEAFLGLRKSIWTVTCAL